MLDFHSFSNLYLVICADNKKITNFVFFPSLLLAIGKGWNFQPGQKKKLKAEKSIFTCNQISAGFKGTKASKIILMSMTTLFSFWFYFPPHNFNCLIVTTKSQPCNWAKISVSVEIHQEIRVLAWRCSIFKTDTSTRYSRFLQGFQNVAARLIMDIPKYSHITPPLCALHWLPIAYRI